MTERPLEGKERNLLVPRSFHHLNFFSEQWLTVEEHKVVTEGVKW